MKTTNYNPLLVLLALLAILACGCKKFLDEKPTKNQVIPSKLKDAQALLDYSITVNQTDLMSGEVSADDYSITDARFSALTEQMGRMYTWQKGNLYDPVINEWKRMYDMVHVANMALETLQGIPRTSENGVQWDQIRGQALYLRAHFYFQGAQVWCLGYDRANADLQPGLPLRLNTNFNEVSVRSTVAQTYGLILQDLTEAERLLPAVAVSPTRPSRQAAHGMLARVYLATGEFAKAGEQASLCLSMPHQLLDFNSLASTAAFPIRQLSAEVIYQSRAVSLSAVSNATAMISRELYNSYQSNDLRKAVFFRTNTDGSFGFKGSYEGSSNYFTGLAADEVYLIGAECKARENKIGEAMELLRLLMVKRFRIDPVTRQSTYVLPQISGQQQAIELVLLERRKELLMRGLRWMDIKRLNVQGANIGITRTVNGTLYKLEPGSRRFAMSIPDDVIQISGMAQND